MQVKEKKLFLCIFLILVFFVAGLSASTQEIAKTLKYAPYLGEPLFVWGQTPVYLPIYFSWYFDFGKDYLPIEFNEAFTWIYSGALGGVILVLIFLMFYSKRQPNLTSHGTARWASIKDIKKSGLLCGDGVVLGMTEDRRYLRHNGSEHLLVMAPTRSGKGIGIIIPTLLTWRHSVMVTDIKGENWGITAGFRKKMLGNRVIKFDPTSDDGSSAKYNPLKEIRLRTKNEVRDAQNIADILVDPQGTGAMDHWAKTGHALMVGVALHLCYTEESATLSSMAAFLSTPGVTFTNTLEIMIATPHDTSGIFKEIYGVDSETHPIVAQAAQELLNKSANELSGVLSTAMSFLGLYRDPIISENTSKSEFYISDLMNHDQPVSLYLVIPPSDINRTTPLMRMILNQVTRRLTESMKFKDGKPVQTYKHRLLLLLDEFPALGRLDSFEKALAFIAGYGLKAMIITQSLNQLNKAYTKDNSIMDNCHIRVVYTPNDEGTAELISKMLGTKTELVKSKSYSDFSLSSFFGKANISESTTSRPLMTSGEVLLIPPEEKVIFVAGVPPIKALKIQYFKDDNFTPRLLDEPLKSDVISIPEDLAPNEEDEDDVNINFAEGDDEDIC